MKRVIAVIIMMIFLVQLVAGLPYLSFGSKRPDYFKCHQEKENEKLFGSSTPIIHVGLVCSKDASVILYECLDVECIERFLVGQGYKVAGKLTTFDGFTDSRRYLYECFECTDITKNRAPVLKVPGNINAKEGEELNINTRCYDADEDDVSLTYGGWMSVASKGLSYKDAGVHEVTVRCEDEWGKSDEATVGVFVRDVNRPPLIVGIY